MLIVGLVDDVRGLSFQSKFAAQIIAAVFAWYCGFQIEILIAAARRRRGTRVASLPLTVLWIVGATNAVNLIDGLDGLATGIALITTTTVAVISFLTGELGVTAASVALFGKLDGLPVLQLQSGEDLPRRLRQHVPRLRARRDFGARKPEDARRRWRSWCRCWFWACRSSIRGWPSSAGPIGCTHQGLRSDSLSRHLRSNYRQIFLPDRDHIHHRLLDLGLSPRRAVSVLYGIGLIFAASAFTMYFSRTPLAGLLLVLVLGLLMAGFLLVLYVRSGRRRAAVKPSESPAVGQPRSRGVKRV